PWPSGAKRQTGKINSLPATASSTRTRRLLSGRAVSTMSASAAYRMTIPLRAEGLRPDQRDRNQSPLKILRQQAAAQPVHQAARARSRRRLRRRRARWWSMVAGRSVLRAARRDVKDVGDGTDELLDVDWLAQARGPARQLGRRVLLVERRHSDGGRQ